jgi:hypothetical protein
MRTWVRSAYGGDLVARLVHRLGAASPTAARCCCGVGGRRVRSRSRTVVPGRGADADLVVLDPAAVTDRATYADPTRPSEGVRPC